MTSTERVLAAVKYKSVDSIPLFDDYWPEFIEKWRFAKHAGPEADIYSYYGVDITICFPDETPWPSRAETLGQEGAYTIRRDGWGVVRRTAPDRFFYQEVTVPLQEKSCPDLLEFESPTQDTRYISFLSNVDQARAAGRCPFVKTGGPYLRTMNLRGIEQWLADLAEDPEYAAALAGRVTDHLIAVGVEGIRRSGLQDNGIWIYDDIACNLGLMVSPRTYERVFLPLMARMVAAYREAGALLVAMHSDGNILSVLDMLVDIGIDAVNPVEPKAGMDVIALREQYAGRLGFVGGLDNAHVLPSGDREQIRAHVLRCAAAAREGGIVLGSHSVGPDISIEDYDYAVSLIHNA